MRLRVVSLFISCSALAVVWACGLNPQPLPPDGYDASAADTSLAANPDTGGGTDASLEDGNVPSGDDAASDASDAGDASDASDAAEDARDDDASDAGEDG
jgi:hypothetical protein